LKLWRGKIKNRVGNGIKTESKLDKRVGPGVECVFKGSPGFSFDFLRCCWVH